MKIVLFVSRFWISIDHEESDLKCRFVACVSSPADGAAGGATAYVTSMAKGKVFQVNLTAGEDEGTVVKEMSLTKKVANDVDLMPPPPAPGTNHESTILTRCTVSNSSTFSTLQPYLKMEM